MQAVGDLFGQAPDQQVELGRHLADHVLLAVFGLEGRAPDLAAARFGEVAEILGEAGDQVRLGEQRIDREIDLEFLVQFQQALADRHRMLVKLLPVRA